MSYFNSYIFNDDNEAAPNINFLDLEEQIDFSVDHKKCLGCGLELQTTNSKEPGYVIDKVHQNYCLRCFKMKNYNKIVDQNLDNLDFIKILDDINRSSEKIRYYYVIDIFDLPGSRVSWLETLIAKKEVVILVNKIDLLPKNINKEKIVTYLKNIFENSPLANREIVLTSSFDKQSVKKLLTTMLNIHYDQYVVGISNTGKSSLINAIVKETGQTPTIVSSKYVNTTLDKIKIQLSSNSWIFDTPGLVKYHHIGVAINTNYWDFLFFKKEIKQKTFQLKPHQAIFYGGLAWFNFESGSETNKTSFHFWTYKNMPLHRTKSTTALSYFKKHRHSLVPRLKEQLNYEFVNHDFIYDAKNSGKMVDIHISGLGWISFTSYEGMKLQIFLPKTEEGVDVYELPKMI